MTILEIINKYSPIIEKEFIDNPRREILYFISFFDNVNLEKLFSNYQYKVINEKSVINAIKRRSRGESVASIIGMKEFFNCKFHVDKHVLIPRPETEFLVEEALELLNINPLKTVIDLCSGPGTIGLTIKKNYCSIDLTMIDKSKIACKLAKQNIINNNIKDTNINIINYDLFDKKIDNNFNFKFDLIVSNPPYIETKIVKRLINKKEVSDPQFTLDGGETGLDFYKRINEFSLKNLSEIGFILLEIGYDQKNKVQNLFNNFRFIKCIKDFGGNDRVLVFKKI